MSDKTDRQEARALWCGAPSTEEPQEQCKSCGGAGAHLLFDGMVVIPCSACAKPSPGPEEGND